MKILIVSNLFEPNTVGGYERLCFRVSENLSRENEVVVLTSDFGDIPSNNDKYKVYRELKLLTGLNNIYRPFDGGDEQKVKINMHNIEVLERVVKDENPDVIFCWNLYFLDKSFLEKLEKIKNKKFFFLTDNWLISFMNPNFLSIYFKKTTNIKNLIFNIYIFLHNTFFNKRKSNTRSTAIFSSNFMKELYGQAGVLFKKNVIIYNGVNLCISPKKDRKYDLLNEDKIRLLFAGRITNIKGLHLLIEAIDILINKYKIKNIRLTVIGNQSDLEYLEKINNQIKDKGIVEYVELKKEIPENELFEEFENNDIFIFPSLYEPFSLTLIQAVSSGIPTIASNTGGNKEIIFNNKTGLLFKNNSPKDIVKKIRKLIFNKKLMEDVSKEGIRKSKDFSFDNMCLNIINFFKQNV